MDIFWIKIWLFFRLGGLGLGKMILLNVIVNCVFGLFIVNGEVVYFFVELYVGVRRGIKLEKG